MLINYEYTKVGAFSMWFFNMIYNYINIFIYNEYDCMKLMQTPEAEWYRKNIPFICSGALTLPTGFLRNNFSSNA